VLDHHAPIISPLVKGEISYRVKEDISHISIEKGFVELNNNKVTVCVEMSSEK
jgi:F-type H+-transporting ATPase subunit epsilon